MNFQFTQAAPRAIALACAAFFAAQAQACEDCEADVPAASSTAPTHRLGLVQVNGAALGLGDAG